MRITIKITKSAQDNAARYYEEAKEMKRKTSGVEKAIAATKEELKNAQKAAHEKKKQIKVKKEKKWHEKFHWFITGEGNLAIGGRDAQQNDFVFSRHLDDGDLFFHADIQGASAVILKNGASAAWDELLETAQFAASYSNAWKNGNANVDVYAVRKEQLSKNVQGMFVAKGGFAITGERKWFRGTKLALKIGKGPESGQVMALPEISKRKLEQEMILHPARGGKEKNEIAKMLAKRLETHIDEIVPLIPSGATKLRLP